ncbi:EboA domain-containing protein [Agromyces humatus]|uniref:EboA domain-containing protein n=1 Tax=Agromyces humatus TaxID=279573 RepID=A0ABP4WWX8_9MICO|nr:EboA domain-containing protein [Agromyces humatus]
MTHPWTTTAVTEITAEPARIAVLFPTAGRTVGRDPVDPAGDPLGLRHGTADDLAREQLVAALLAAAPADTAAASLSELYRYGDDAERRGVLRGLNAAPDQQQPIVSIGLELVADALRTNDTRLVAAALGDFAGAHLDDHAWRHGVLKALFMGIPVDVVARLDERADDELARMAAGLIAERRAAGREINADMRRVASGASTAATASSTTTTPTPGG